MSWRWVETPAPRGTTCTASTSCNCPDCEGGCGLLCGQPAERMGQFVGEVGYVSAAKAGLSFQTYECAKHALERVHRGEREMAMEQAAARDRSRALEQALRPGPVFAALEQQREEFVQRLTFKCDIKTDAECEAVFEAMERTREGR